VVAHPCHASSPRPRLVGAPLAGLALLACACASSARPADTRGAGASASLAGYEYVTLVTAGAKPEGRLPMIVGLHYSSASPEVIVPFFDQIDFPARVLLPRGKYPRDHGSSWFPSSYGELAPAEQVKLTFQIRDELSAFLDAATQRHPTAGKPAIMGASYGGDLSYLIATHHPSQVSAAFPVAARFPAEWLPATNTCQPSCPPIHAMHGDKDAIVPIDGGRLAAKQLTELGFPVELHEYKDVPHDFTDQMKADFTRAVRAVLEREVSAAAPR
jgi:phospholipase/carboxylesterase